MFLFGRSKLGLKIRREEDEYGFKNIIEYHEIKHKDVFNVNVLRELIGDNFCLGVIDSKLLYYGPQEKAKVTFEEITNHLAFTRVPYKKIEIKKTPEMSIFGLTVKKGSKKTDKDYIIGFAVNKDNFKRVEEYVNKLNISYFIDKAGFSEEAILQKLEENYEDIEEMGKDFYCQIFNNNFIDQMVISSGSELTSEIKEIVNKCYLELK